MLGISRGTLRTALARLEDSGEIVRRQGSGTFVGRVAVPTALNERLERLEPYSSLAKRRGVALAAVQLRIERRGVGREVGEALNLDAEAHATTTSRLLLADGEPVAVMFDVVHPSVALPDGREAAPLPFGRAEMVLDVLIDIAVPIALGRTRVIPWPCSRRAGTQEDAAREAHDGRARAGGGHLRLSGGATLAKLFKRPADHGRDPCPGGAIARSEPARSGSRPLIPRNSGAADASAARRARAADSAAAAIGKRLASSRIGRARARAARRTRGERYRPSASSRLARRTGGVNASTASQLASPRWCPAGSSSDPH